MASKLLSLRSLRERRKPKDDTDELAIVKAAAWAWYQHGSGFEGKAMNEFDITRTQRAPRPSRYKQEAMRMSQEAKEGSLFHSKNSLLDAYEVLGISKQLESLVEPSHNKVYNGLRGSNFSASASLEDGGRRMTMIKKKKTMGKGFWLRHAVVCGTREDVVDVRALSDGHLSARRVPVVNLPKCIPRAKSEL